MKTLAHLEKSRSFWSILLICLIFFFLRFPSIIEPYWYGDEGVYEVIGQALNQGRVLYTGIWDNKPPLLYVVYALFNGNQESVRFTSLLLGILATISFFYLTRRLFKKTTASIIATSLFALLFATPFLEGNIANAENFMLLPVIAAATLLYTQTESKLNQYKSLFLSGLLLGIAFLFKIVAIFDLMAFSIFLLLQQMHHTKNVNHLSRQWNIIRKHLIPIVLGFLVPLFITMTYFLFFGALNDFIQATFFGNIGYVGYGNKLFNIPQGLLITKLLFLLIVISTIFLKKKHISRPTMFITLWFAFALFNAFFSQRPYTHYLLVLLPSICLLIGLFFETSQNKLRLLLLVVLISTFSIIKNNFWITKPEKIPLYYQNVVLFITGHKDVKSYRSFFDQKTPRDYELASIITKETKPEDEVFIWGDSPQIYALAHKLPLNKYTVAYHIKQNKKSMEETQMALLEKKPKLIITLSETSMIPFTLPFYTLRFVTTGATIYERNF